MYRRLNFAVFAVALVAFAAPSTASAQATASFTVDEAKAKTGQKLFASKACSGCHTVGKGKSAGPDLHGVLDRREVDWLTRWLANTDEMIASDPVAQELVKEFKGVKMPNMKLKEQEIEAVLHYIADATAKTKKKG